ncbi:MAG: BtpA/SgcQ family protein [Deltaproteobacteria bacterium]|jgi:membrane complex biogenesis BtpA family protein|nr:BtpA/SgcQ family protein [Deltaproteobacteria bacterium]MBW2534111.1 BtpA/SgcQ family protein [Deltaproteobacteria bacterium]
MVPKTASSTPRLCGVIHLRPLPSSPRFDGSLGGVIAAAIADARALVAAGFDSLMVENFGDAPFVPGSVEPVTVAAMTACVREVQAVAPGVAIGINVLRNDARAALSIAAATDARMVRINVHSGARVTDQGLLEGRAHDTLRLRRALSLGHVALWCDVAVKHSAPLADRPLGEEARELCERALADAVLLTGSATGSPVRVQDLLSVRQSVPAPVLIASGMDLDNVDLCHHADGVIVGSSLRASGRAGDPIDPDRAQAFAEAFQRATAT